jgi:hypothetical protein
MLRRWMQKHLTTREKEKKKISPLYLYTTIVEGRREWRPRSRFLNLCTLSVSQRNAAVTRRTLDLVGTDCIPILVVAAWRLSFQVRCMPAVNAAFEASGFSPISVSSSRRGKPSRRFLHFFNTVLYVQCSNDRQRLPTRAGD